MSQPAQIQQFQKTNSTPNQSPKKATLRDRGKVAFSIFLGLGIWYLFASIAHYIVTTVPLMEECYAVNRGLARCVYAPWSFFTKWAPAPTATATDWVVLLLSLVAALWAAYRAVYPMEDDTDSPPTK